MRLGTESPVCWPYDYAPRRAPARRRKPAAVKKKSVSVRVRKSESSSPTEEQLGTWAVRGGIVMVMLAITIFFHAPLLGAFEALLQRV